ncbi:hypothetical protein P4K68_28390 [Bacillus cereus]|nr:hypothetical protein [Bacillus cereus]
MRRDGDELDERGYPPYAYTKIDQFIVDFKKDPSKFQEYLDKIYYSEELKKRSGESYPTDEELFRRTAELYLFEDMDVDLGTAVEWDEQAIVGRCPRCQYRCRRCKGNCIAWFSHPSLDEIRDDVIDCALAAAVIATLAAIWANPAAALPVFKESFYTCLTSKGVEWAEEIGVGLHRQSSCGDWHRCG